MSRYNPRAVWDDLTDGDGEFDFWQSLTGGPGPGVRLKQSTQAYNAANQGTQTTSKKRTTRTRRRPTTRQRRIAMKKKLIWLVAGFLILLILWMGSNGVPIPTIKAIHFPWSIDTVRIESVFVDINNDGLVDYIKSADVIINDGQVP